MHAWQDEIVKEEEKEDVKEEVKEEYVEVEEEEEEDMHDMHGMLNEEEKMILKEGHDRCFLKRIFAIYAEHRPTVPMDEVVETVDQVGSGVKDFYQALCTVHGLAALRPTWEPDDARPDWVPEFLLRDRSGVVDAVTSGRKDGTTRRWCWAKCCKAKASANAKGGDQASQGAIQSTCTGTNPASGTSTATTCATCACPCQGDATTTKACSGSSSLVATGSTSSCKTQAQAVWGKET